MEENNTKKIQIDDNKKVLIGVFGLFVIIGTVVYLLNANKKDSMDTNSDTQVTQSFSTEPNNNTIPDPTVSTNSVPSPTSTEPIKNLQEIKKANLTLQQKLDFKKPEMFIEVNKTYEATIKTSAGDITLNLNAKMVPKTVNNFVYLANSGFYKDVIFHRVIKDFMIQAGDPKGDGTGGPGYKLEDEKFEGEYKKGAIAMARTFEPNSAGSQFFIMHKDVPLPKDYVIFGEVTKGIETVDKIATAETIYNEAEGANSKPKEPVKILDVLVVEK